MPDNTRLPDFYTLDPPVMVEEALYGAVEPPVDSNPEPKAIDEKPKQRRKRRTKAEMMKHSKKRPRRKPGGKETQEGSTPG